MKKFTLSEELLRIKNLMVYKNGDYKDYLYEYELLKEAPTDDVKEVSLAANFKSGRWKDQSMPKQEILSELSEAIDWLKSKSDLIKQSGGIIDGKAKILTVQIESGESQVTNYDTEVDPKVKVDVGVLSERRARTIQNFLTTYFKKLQKDGAIDAIPIFEPPKIIIGQTPWKPEEGDKASDEKFTKEQFIKVNLKLTPPSACLEGLTIEVMYVKEPNPSFPCRGGHQCDDALFDVYLNEVKLDGVANLNNAKDGGSRSSKFTVSPQQALSILGNKPGNIMISFVCKNTDRRCHSSTPEIRLSRGSTVIYHACTPSISEDNDYRKINVMELDACGNLIKKGQEKKTAQKDAELMKPPAGLQKGWLVYDIATKLPVFKPSSSASDLQENMYKKYLPLYGYSNFETGKEPEIYKGKCNEPKIYGGWCLWSGSKMNYLNDNFCDGAEYGSLYRFGSESSTYTNASKKVNESMRSYILDNCDKSNLELNYQDVILVDKSNIPEKFNTRRLYSVRFVDSIPDILGNSNYAPFKITNTPNNKNFTPNEFINFVKNIGGINDSTDVAPSTTNYKRIIDLLKTSNQFDKSSTLSNGMIMVPFFVTDQLSDIFPNTEVIKKYLSKYVTFKNEKFSGRVYVGKISEWKNQFWNLHINMFFENGEYKNTKISVSILEKDLNSTIAKELEKKKKIKMVGDKWTIV